MNKSEVSITNNLTCLDLNKVSLIQSTLNLSESEVSKLLNLVECYVYNNNTENIIITL